MSQIIRDMLEISRCGVQYRSDNLSPMGLKSIHASYLTEICANPGISQDNQRPAGLLGKLHHPGPDGTGEGTAHLPAWQDERPGRALYGRPIKNPPESCSCRIPGFSYKKENAAAVSQRRYVS